MDRPFHKVLPRRAGAPLSSTNMSTFAMAEAARAGAAAIVAAINGGPADQATADAANSKQQQGPSRKQKKRTKSASRAREKARLVSQKHIAMHKMVTIESLAPASGEASSFMRTRLKRQKRRMEAQSQSTMDLFKARREAGVGFRSAQDVSHEAMKLFGAADPKGQRKEAKRVRAYLESQRTEPIRKRFWDLKDFGAPATNSKHDEIAAATRAIYASESENESDDDAQDGTDKGSAPNDGDSSQPRASTAALLDYFKQRIKTYKPPANDDAKSQTDNSEPSMELKLLRKSLGVVVKDHPQHRCPPPLASFFDPRLPVHFAAYFGTGRNRARFKKPSAIQAQCWPAALSGYDVLGISPTGSGKTLAFTLPMIPHIHAQRFPRAAEGPIALIITPTRELAAQIAQICEGFRKRFGIKTLCVQGGHGSKAEQVERLLNEPWHIVVSTPGRAVELVGLQLLQLGRVSYLVLDEADQLLSMGFETQMEALTEGVHGNCQRMLFSATFPLKLRNAAERWTSGNAVVTIRIRPVSVTKSSTTVARVDNDEPSDKAVADAVNAANAKEAKNLADGGTTSAGGSAASTMMVTISPTVVQVVRVMHASDRFAQLIRLIEELRTMEREQGQRHPGPMLVFCNTVDSVKELTEQLASSGVKCVPLHGRMQQRNRNLALSDFRSGKARCLVATEVASRGLDIKKLSYVVNFDFPKSVAAYVQRVGRTGHQGQKGWGYSFITEHHAPSAARIVGFLDATGQKVDLALRRFAERFEALPPVAKDSNLPTPSSPKAQPERKRKATRKNGAKEVPEPKRKRNPKGKRVDNRSANSSTRSGELQQLSEENNGAQLETIRGLIVESVKEAAAADIAAAKNGAGKGEGRDDMIERAIDAARDDAHGLVVRKVKKAAMPKGLRLARKLSYLERVTNMYIHYNPAKLLPPPTTQVVVTNRGRKVTAPLIPSGPGATTAATAATQTAAVEAKPDAAAQVPDKPEESFVQQLMRKCAGKEEQLIARLVKQYGPEPAVGTRK